MLSLPSFSSLLRAGTKGPGWVIVVFLATFQPIGKRFGIPGVQQAAIHLSELVTNLAPEGALVGSVSDLTTGVFVPQVASASIDSYVTSIRMAAAADDLELEAGEWAEIRVAVGVMPISSGEFDAREVTIEAARKAETDLAKFPQEWAYPIVVFDD